MRLRPVRTWIIVLRRTRPKERILRPIRGTSCTRWAVVRPGLVAKDARCSCFEPTRGSIERLQEGNVADLAVDPAAESVSCAVIDSGKVSCWGNDQRGRLGNRGTGAHERHAARGRRRTRLRPDRRRLGEVLGPEHRGPAGRGNHLADTRVRTSRHRSRECDWPRTPSPESPTPPRSTPKARTPASCVRRAASPAEVQPLRPARRRDHHTALDSV